VDFPVVLQPMDKDNAVVRIKALKIILIVVSPGRN
jgi:hypothetical protein